MSILDSIRAYLATDSPLLLVSPRRRALVAETVAITGGTATGLTTAVSITDALNFTSGLWLEQLSGEIGWNSGSSGTITIESLQSELQTVVGNVLCEIGQPVLTVTTVMNTAANVGRANFVLQPAVPLLTYFDLATWAGIAGFSLGQPLQFAVIANLSSATSGTALLRVRLAYRLVTGIADG
jgi:hypothetical protein